MRRLYNAKRVNEFDREMRMKHALSSISLIENAAFIAYEEIKERAKEKRSLILIGSGNNGADGLALFLLMHRAGLYVRLFYVEEAKSEENRHFRTLIDPSFSVSFLDGYDIIIDAVYGASYHPPLKDEVRALFDEVNRTNAFKVAIDVPSAYYFNAELTVTFTMLKKEQFILTSSQGRIVLGNPGFPVEEVESYPPDGYLIEDSDYDVPPFRSSDYKNTRGHLLMMAGSPSYRGAMLMSARAAFHAGCGLVTLCTQKEMSDIACFYPPLIIRCGISDYSSYSALLAGPGWGEYANRDFISFKGNMVLDAEALNMIEKGDDFSYRAVLTPHIGEFRRLTSRLGIAEDALSLSRALKAVVVKKGSIVEIACADERYYYIGNNPSLGVAGSGDVLSGIIGSLLASGLSPLDAAINGVILHQRSGAKAHDRLGYYDALDLIEEVGRLR